MKVYLAAPRGYCAGVDRAVQTLELALQTYGAPIYVRHAIIHNTTILQRFTERGVIFVEDIHAVPPGAVALFSAHGVPQQVYDAADELKLHAIDATCPLVTKVHHEIKRFAKQGYHIFLIGHAGHVEIEGTAGHAPPTASTLIETCADAESVIPPQTEKLAILTQTTLSVDETADIQAILLERFPQSVVPKKGDICYATQNRQDAVKAIAPQVEVFLVVGSRTSSNSNRLRDTALRYGTPRAYLVDHVGELTPAMTANATTVGLTSGASVPEELVQAVLHHLNPTHIETITTAEENVRFELPIALRRPQTHSAP